MKLFAFATIGMLSACVTSTETEPELDTTQQELTGSQIATLNQIGSEVGLSFAWTGATRGAPARLQENLTPTTAAARDTNAMRLDGGFENRLHVDPGAIDPCWFLEVGPSGVPPVVAVHSLRGGSGYGAATFTTKGTNFTIEGTASATDPSQPNFALQFVVRDASGAVVFDSAQH